MFSIQRWVLFACAVVSAVSASGAQTTIAGSIYEDRMSLAVRPHFVGAEGVTVRLYRDDGDRALSAADPSIASTKSDASGVYVFRVDRPGPYWVAVDSHTFAAGSWPEQTFGPAGSLCAHPDRGTIAAQVETPCFGGRTALGSDDASSLLTSEHVALVDARESVTNADFAFSYDVVVSTADAGQGSLRQFFVNANAVRRPNRMRFVPLQRAGEKRMPDRGVPLQWWAIRLSSPLPRLTDDDTIVDGTAYNFLSAATFAAGSGGRFGEPDAIIGRERRISRLERPDLEIVAAGDVGVACDLRCGVRNVALHGAATGIVTRGDSRIDQVLIGAAPDGTAVNDGTTGVSIERGTVAIRHLRVVAQALAGMTVSPEARVDADYLEISHCGQPKNGAGIALLGDGSSIRDSAVTDNPVPGILLGEPGGARPARGNVLDGNTISGNEAGVVLAPGSTRNAVTRNDIMWNRVGGIIVVPHAPDAAPRENRISANRFDENGVAPILLDARTSSAACDASLPLAAPEVTSVTLTEEGGRRALVRGRACPGRIVEIYQSYVTSQQGGESAALSPDSPALPSSGEFNYVGATNAGPDGTFQASFPLPVIVPTSASESDAYWLPVLAPVRDPRVRAFAALSIDAQGNTSPMSERRRLE